jgi:small-conductance mechanosensitive channel
LKATNLIFLEHKKFKLENNELNKQISNYQKVISTYQYSDSIQKIEVSKLLDNAKITNDLINSKDKQIKKLSNKSSMLGKFVLGELVINCTLLAIILIN